MRTRCGVASKLKSAETATTVRLDRGEPVITDGPFVEGKEVVSGYVEIEVADLDEALQAWPRPGPAARSSRSARSSLSPCDRCEYDAQLARVVREHAGRLAASLMHVTGDFATAEDLVQDAVLAALRHWPAEGIPSGRMPGCSPSPAPRPRRALRREHNYRRQAGAAAVAGPTGARRAAAADLHLLPPGAAPAGTDRAHPASRVRPDHRPDRPSVPRAGNHGGATDHPRQAEDHRRRNPVPDPRPTTSSAPA